jgi:hypothetical protein
MPKKSARAAKPKKKLSTLAPKTSDHVRGGGINRIVVRDGTIKAKI